MTGAKIDRGARSGTLGRGWLEIVPDAVGVERTIARKNLWGEDQHAQQVAGGEAERQFPMIAVTPKRIFGGPKVSVPVDDS